MHCATGMESEGKGRPFHEMFRREWLSSLIHPFYLCSEGTSGGCLWSTMHLWKSLHWWDSRMHGQKTITSTWMIQGYCSMLVEIVMKEANGSRELALQWWRWLWHTWLLGCHAIVHLTAYIFCTKCGQLGMSTCKPRHSYKLRPTTWLHRPK